MESRLYYEGHITLAAPVTCEPALEQLVELHGGRLSKFAMLKTDEEPLGFISMRDRRLAHIIARMNRLCSALEKHGWEIKRYKIEDTLLDTQHGDARPWQL